MSAPTRENAVRFDIRTVANIHPPSMITTRDEPSAGASHKSPSRPATPPSTSPATPTCTRC